ncbi:MAG: hypothetical protein APF76_16115 [Desulfitibacter sp. BRH_c19]|nr:MAG: hypothetical protein APF76_16115 [Desulfitibacter sp. BRH_c19]
MKGKKLLSLILAIVMIMSFTIGCSTAELGLYKMINEMKQLTKYEQSGEIEINISVDELATSEMNIGELITMQKIEAFLGENNIAYLSEWDLDEQQGSLILMLKNKDNQETTDFFTLIYNQETIYIDIEQLFSFAQIFMDEETFSEDDMNMVKEIFEGTQYLSIDLKDIEEMLIYDMQDPEQVDVLMKYYDPVKAKTTQKYFDDFIDGLIKNVYDNYSMDIVEGGNNKYTVTFDLEDLAIVLISLIEYSVDNIEELSMYVKDYIDATDDEVINDLSILLEEDPVYLKEQIKGTMDMMVVEVTTNEEMIKEDLREFRAEVAGPEYKDILNNFNTMVAFEKLEDESYQTSLQTSFRYVDQFTQQEMFNVEFKIDQTLVPLQSVTVNVPTDNVMTLEQLRTIIDEIESAQNTEKSLVLTLEQGQAIVDGSPMILDVPPFMRNGRTLVPFRFIGEQLGASIDWNATDRSVSYITQDTEITLYIDSTKAIIDGEEITLDTPPILKDGRTVVPVRFISEALGFSVDWLPDVRQITITGSAGPVNSN